MEVGYHFLDFLLFGRKMIAHFLFKKMLRREGGSGVYFCMFGSYVSTFYRWTDAFYGTKISRRDKKLLIFEGQPLDNFPIKIYRGNLVKIWSLVHIFLYFDLRYWKTYLNGEDQWVLMKLDEFVGKNTKIWEILTKMG